VHPVAVAALDSGEAATIQLALERGIRRVCIDDLKGRRVALAVGLEVTGLLGLLARARALGLVDAVRPWVERLVEGGAWYDDDLIRRVLASLGE